MLSEAAAAVQAIKPTIEHGTIISKTENYKNTGVDRYIIAAKGNINGKESYVGVMVKAYPKARLNSKFYLHEATIIETDSHIMTAALKSNKTVSESASNPSIAKDKQNVNPSETNSSDKLGFSKETAEEFAENEKAAIEKALANMSDAEYNRIGWARTLFTREDVDKLSKVNGEKLKDGIVALKVNNKIVFSDGKAEAPTYYAVLVFDANTTKQVETSSFYYFKGEGFSSLSQNDIRNLIERGKRYGTYGFYRSSYKRVGKEYSVQAGLPTGSKGFTDSAFLVVRGGVYSEDKGRVSRDIQGRGRVSNTVAAKSETVSMTKARIDSLIEDSGAGSRTDYAKAWITSINPTDFLNMTLSEEKQNREYFDTMPGDYGYTVDEYDYIEGLKKETRQTPYLAINYETGEVVGHEGRHRMRALEKSGIKSAAVKIEFRDIRDGGWSPIEMLNGKGNPLTTIESLQIFNQRGTGQSAEIFNVIPLNKSHRDEIYSSYGNNDTALQYSEETETSRDTLVSDMEAVAETDEEKSFVEKLKAEVEKANALQEELDEVNRKIKEDLFCIVQHIGHKRTYCYVCVQR